MCFTGILNSPKDMSEKQHRKMSKYSYICENHGLTKHLYTPCTSPSYLSCPSYFSYPSYLLCPSHLIPLTPCTSHTPNTSYTHTLYPLYSSYLSYLCTTHTHFYTERLLVALSPHLKFLIPSNYFFLQIRPTYHNFTYKCRRLPSTMSPSIL